MEIAKLQHADILDIIFDNRNKDYGAYQLRKTYSKRITKALLLTGILATAIISLAFLPQPSEQNKALSIAQDSVVLIERTLPPDVIPPVEPARQPAAPWTPVRTEQLSTIKIVKTEVDVDAIATPEDLQKAQIDVARADGVEFTNKPPLPEGPLTTGIIELPPPRDEEPLREVDQHAKFQGDWVKFLRRNLRSEVPVDNDAPAGRYTVLVEFIVDADGNVSNVTAITQHGYGLEQEAVRVIKKSDKWIPSFWKGRPVKAYHRQQITFEVVNE